MGSATRTALAARAAPSTVSAVAAVTTGGSRADQDGGCLTAIATVSTVAPELPAPAAVTARAGGGVADRAEDAEAVAAVAAVAGDQPAVAAISAVVGIQAAVAPVSAVADQACVATVSTGADDANPAVAAVAVEEPAVAALLIRSRRRHRCRTGCRRLDPEARRHRQGGRRVRPSRGKLLSARTIRSWSCRAREMPAAGRLSIPTGRWWVTSGAQEWWGRTTDACWTSRCR